MMLSQNIFLKSKGPSFGARERRCLRKWVKRLNVDEFTNAV